MAAFPLKLGATQLRVLLVSVNVLLACGLVGAGAWSMLQKRTTSQVDVRPRSDFAPKKIPVSKKTGASLIVSVSDQLRPQKKQPPAPPPKKDENEDEGEDELVNEPTEGGPLAETWKYAFYIVDHDDPLSTHITLRKIEPKGKTGAKSRSRRRTATPRRGGRSSSRSRSGARSKRGVASKPEDIITFYLYERKFRVPNEEEDYYVDSPDQTRFVYWAAKEGPEQLYALVYKEPTIYGEDPEKGLRPGEDEDDKDKDEDEEEEVKFFVNRPTDYERDFEDEYFQIRSGKLDLKDAHLINEKAKEIEAGKASEAKAALRRPPPSKKPPRPSVRGRPAAAKPAVEAKSGSPEEGTAPENAESPAPKKEMSKEEGLKEIGNILEEADRAGKLSDEEKKAAKELKEMLTPPRRKAYSGGSDG